MYNKYFNNNKAAMRLYIAFKKDMSSNIKYAAYKDFDKSIENMSYVDATILKLEILDMLDMWDGIYDRLNWDDAIMGLYELSPINGLDAYYNDPDTYNEIIQDNEKRQKYIDIHVHSLCISKNINNIINMMHENEEYFNYILERNDISYDIISSVNDIFEIINDTFEYNIEDESNIRIDWQIPSDLEFDDPEYNNKKNKYQFGLLCKLNNTVENYNKHFNVAVA